MSSAFWIPSSETGGIGGSPREMTERIVLAIARLFSSRGWITSAAFQSLEPVGAERLLVARRRIAGRVPPDAGTRARRRRCCNRPSRRCSRPRRPRPRNSGTTRRTSTPKRAPSRTSRSWSSSAINGPLTASQRPPRSGRRSSAAWRNWSRTTEPSAPPPLVARTYGPSSSAGAGFGVGLRAAEVAAVVNRDSGRRAEPVLVEVHDRGVAVDADLCVAVAQRLVDAGLLPELADEGRLVHDVAEARDRRAALSLRARRAPAAARRTGRRA